MVGSLMSQEDDSFLFLSVARSFAQGVAAAMLVETLISSGKFVSLWLYDFPDLLTELNKTELRDVFVPEFFLDGCVGFVFWLVAFASEVRYLIVILV